jgi:hypothetical protein
MVKTLAMLAQLSPPISDTTAVSLATVLVLVAAAWTLSKTLSAISTKLDGLKDLPEKVQRMEVEIGGLKGEMRTMEGDINNLWSAYRGDPPLRSRAEGRHTSGQGD